jgi:hypothetical protein
MKIVKKKIRRFIQYQVLRLRQNVVRYVCVRVCCVLTPFKSKINTRLCIIAARERSEAATNVLLLQNLQQPVLVSLLCALRIHYALHSLHLA